MEIPKKATSVYLEFSLHGRAKALALKEKSSLTDLIAEGLNLIVDENGERRMREYNQKRSNATTMRPACGPHTNRNTA